MLPLYHLSPSPSHTQQHQDHLALPYSPHTSQTQITHREPRSSFILPPWITETNWKKTRNTFLLRNAGPLERDHLADRRPTQHTKLCTHLLGARTSYDTIRLDARHGLGTVTCDMCNFSSSFFFHNFPRFGFTTSQLHRENSFILGWLPGMYMYCSVVCNFQWYVKTRIDPHPTHTVHTLPQYLPRLILSQPALKLVNRAAQTCHGTC